MSWFDDEDAFAEGFLEGLVDPAEEGNEEDIERPEVLNVGDTVADLYIVEDVVRPNVARVQLLDVDRVFELRQFPELRHKRVFDQVEFVVKTTGFLTSEYMTYITDFGVCPIFGGYIVSEWVEGQSLGSVLEAGKQMELSEAFRFALDVGTALSALHDAGLAFGFRDAQDLVRNSHEQWRLLAVGLGTSALFPPKTPLPVAPELQGVRGSSALGDQYALAAALYGLLVGEIPWGENPFGPSELRVDLPESLNRAVMRAMHQESEKRFPTIHEFLEVIVESARFWQEESVTLHESSFAFSSTPSIVVTVESPLLKRPLLSMSFSSVERLRREYRNNIVADGIFVPTSEPLTRNQIVDVDLVFEPTNSMVRVEGTIAQVNVFAGQINGAGLVLGTEAKTKILEFLKRVDPVFGLMPTDVIMAVRALDIHSALEPAEAFLLSRMNAPMPLGVLRSAFQGLPFDFEEALGGLIQKEYVVIKDHVAPVNTPRVAQHSATVSRAESSRKETAYIVPKVMPVSSDKTGNRPAEKPVPALASHKIPSHADHVLEHAGSLQQEGDFRTAIEVLEAAHLAVPDGRFLLGLVQLYGTFQKNWVKARERLEEAARIMPGNPEVSKLRTWLDTQCEEELIRVVYSLKTPGAKIRFLRLDPQLHRVWFEIFVGGNGPRREIHVVDYARGSGSMLRQAMDPTQMAVVPGNTPKHTSFNAARQQITNTQIGRPDKMIDRAQSSINPGPWFRKGPAPVAWTSNSLFLVFDRNPDVLEEGLYIVSQGSQMAPLKLDPDGTRGVRPVMCPDEQGTVAWVSLRPSPAVYVAEIFQSPQKRLEMQGDAIVRWLNAENLIVLSIATGEVLEVPRRRGGLNKTLVTLKNACGMWLDGTLTHAAVLTNQRVVFRVEISTGKIVNEMTLATFPEDLLLRDDGYLAARYRDHTVVARFGKTTSHRLDVVADPGCFHATVRWTGREPLVLLVAKSERCEVLRVDPRRLFAG